MVFLCCCHACALWPELARATDSQRSAVDAVVSAATAPLTSQLSQLSTALHSAEERRRKCESELTEARESLRAAQNSTQELDSISRAAALQHHTIKEDLDSKLQKAVKSLQSHRERLKAATDRAQALEQQHSTLVMKLENVCAVCCAVPSHDVIVIGLSLCVMLRSVLMSCLCAASTSASADCVQLELECTALRDQLRVSERDRTAYEAKAQSAASLSAALRTAEHALTTERTKREAESEAEKEERERLSGELERERVKSARALNEAQALHWAELQSWHERVQKSEQKVVDSGNARDALQRTLDTLRSDMDQKQNQIRCVWSCVAISRCCDADVMRCAVL
jgi:chromosome segregation ATPase